MTQGDHHNCKCPHCGKNNHHVTLGRTIPHDTLVEFTLPCTHCKKNVYYWARWEIAVTAEKEEAVT